MADHKSPPGLSSHQQRISSPRSFSSRRSSSSSSESDSDSDHVDVIDAVTKSSSSPQSQSESTNAESRRCNRYGWFMESDEAQYEETPLSRAKLMNREAKWLEMTSSEKKWSRWVNKKFRILRSRCRKGIPHSVRGRAWLFLTGAHLRLATEHHLFERLDSSPGKESIVEEIRRDLHRQFPSHEMFAKAEGSGQQDLFRVLKAYSILKPEVGYCQGQAPLAAVLLMVMPAEQAFWTLTKLCDHYVEGYFDPGLEKVQLHGDMLYSLLRLYYPSAYKILKKQKIEPVLYMTEWFMCLFSRTLPWPLVLRVWDMFMCEGIIVIFKVAIVLIGTVLGNEKKNCQTMYETLQLLKNPPKKYMQEKDLLNRVTRLELTTADLKREHAIQSAARKMKRFTEEKKKQAASAAAANNSSSSSSGNNRRSSDSLKRSVREHKSEKSVIDNRSSRKVNGYTSLPVKASNNYATYSSEPEGGNRRHRRTTSTITVRGEWVENEVRNRRTRNENGQSGSFRGAMG